MVLGSMFGEAFASFDEEEEEEKLPKPSPAGNIIGQNIADPARFTSNAAQLSPEQFLLSGAATHPDERDGQEEYSQMLNALQTGQDVGNAWNIAQSHSDAHSSALNGGPDSFIDYPQSQAMNQGVVDGFGNVLGAYGNLSPSITGGYGPDFVPTYGPPAPADPFAPGLNPTQGGFRGPENPANLQPGPNADMGIFDPFAAASAITPNYIERGPSLGLLDVPGAASAITPNYIEEAPRPGPLELYGQDMPLGISDFMREEVLPRTGAVGEFIFSGPNALGLGMPNPGAQDIGRFLGEGIPPVSAGDFALGAGLSKGPIEMLTGVPLDDLVRGAVRFASPEQMLSPGSMYAGVPLDPFIPPTAGGQIPHVGDPNQYLGTFDPGMDAMLSPAIIDEKALPSPPSLVDLNAPARMDVVDQRAYEVSQMWAEGLPNEAATLSDMRTGLYNAGLESSGTAKQVTDRYAAADVAGIRMPLEQPPSEMPDAIDLARRGATPQSPTTPVAGDTRLEMQQAMDNARLTGGGGASPDVVTGGGTGNVSPPPPASLSVEREYFNVAGTAPARADDAIARMSDKPAPGAFADWAAKQRMEGVPGGEAFMRARDNHIAEQINSLNTSGAGGAPTTPAQRITGNGYTNGPGRAATPSSQLAQQAAQVAPALNMPPNLAADWTKAWLDTNITLLDQAYSPRAMGRAMAAAEATLLGNARDPYINELLKRQDVLEEGLKRSEGGKLRGPALEQAVKDGLEREIRRHASGNVAEVARVRQELADIAKRGAEIEKDFKVLSDLNARVKNTMFGLMDTGMFMVQGAAAMKNGMVPFLAGSIDQGLAMLKLPHFVNLQAETGLPRVLAELNAGLNLGREASGLNTSAGTIFRYGPTAPIDKHLITPAVEKMTDLQFKGVMGFVKDRIFTGELMMAKLAKQDIANPVVQAQAAKVANDIASSGELASKAAPLRGKVEELSLLSPAMTRAMTGRVVDMAQLINPAASETERILAASMILSNVVAIGVVGKLINDQVGITPWKDNPFDFDYGTVTLNAKDDNGQNLKMSLLSQAGLEKAIVKSAAALADGDTDALIDTWARFGTTREGWLLGSGMRAAGWGYDSNGKFHKGDMPTEERIRASLPLPPILSGALNGRTDKTTLGLSMIGGNPYPETAGTEFFRENKEAKALQESVLVDRAALNAAFPKNPEMANNIFGREWAALEFHEQKTILDSIRATDPEKAKVLDEAVAAQAQLNKEKPSAIGNAMAIRQSTDDNISAIRDQMKKDADGELTDMLFNGKHDARDVAAVVKALKAVQSEDIAIEAWKGGTTYTGLPWPEGKSNDRATTSALEQAITEWKGLGEHASGKDGKFNYDALQAAQHSYLSALNESDRPTAERLSFYVQTREAQAEAQKPELFKFYDYVSKETEEYWDQATGTKASWLREHPREDALLHLVGWMPELHSRAAADILKDLAPNRTPVMERR